MSSSPLRRREALGALAGLLLVACSKRGGAGSRARVVSLSPSTTEAAFAIGAGALLVGRSRYCDYPEAAAALPVVGGFSDPNVETIVALAPTLVIGAHGPAGPALEQTLQAHGIATFFPETESMAQIEAMLTGLGARLGADAGAVKAVAAIEEARSRVRAGIAGKVHVRAALLFDVGPIVAAGPGGFPDQLLREAGAENVITAGGPYPTIGVERLLALDPEVLLDGASDEHGPGSTSRVAAMRDAPGWRDLRAMREDHVRLLSSGAALRPGPRIGQGLIAFARALHGEAAVPEALR